MSTAQTANLVSNQPLIDLKMFHLVTCKTKYSIASWHQSENWETRNGPELLQAFPKKWWAESDFTDDIGHTF
jgi:hypothetical protein